MKYALGNMLNGAGGLNADQLALDLQFAADKTLTARKGPTPVLTRGSTGTYFGPNSINVQYTYTGDTYNVNLSQDAIVNGKWQWRDGDTEVYFGGSNWLLTHDSNLVATSESTTSWRPDGANWSGTGATVTTQSTFGIVRAANNEPRFDHDPVTLACRGLLIEEGRTNLVFPSAALTTQTRTVTAVAHTLSFYGTGTVVLSGTHSATVVGTGAFPTRRIFNFTPTAGSLTLTVTGTVQFAQLEVGAFPTSYIPTTTAALARSGDVCSITGANFTNLWNNNEGTVFASGDPRASASIATYLMANSGANANQVSIYRNTTANTYGVANSGSYTVNISASASNGSFNKIAGSYITNDARAAFNNVLGTPDTSVIVPTNLTRLNIGSSNVANSEFTNGCISAIRYYKKSLSNAKLQALTA